MGRVLRAMLAAAALTVAVAPAAHAGGQNTGANDPNPLLGQTWWDQSTKWNPTWGEGSISIAPLRLGRITVPRADRG